MEPGRERFYGKFDFKSGSVRNGTLARLSRIRVPTLMTAFRIQINQWFHHKWIHPLVLLIVAVLTFGLLIPWLGFYWDDWQAAWFIRTLGPAGFDEVFGEVRPNLHLTYFLTTSILGESPPAWHIFGLLTRWLSSVAVWWLLRQVWASRSDVAAIGSLIFLVFPGFSQQFISIIYSHFFLFQAAHIFSLGLMVRAIRKPRHRFALTALSIGLALYSLLSIEYYFGLEALRPLLIYWALANGSATAGARVKQTLRFWLPYIPILPAFLLWRTLFVGFPTYQPEMIDRILNQPVRDSVVQLLRLITGESAAVAVGSWLRILPLPNPDSFGMFSMALLTAVFVAVFLLTAAYLRRFSNHGSRNIKLAGAVFFTGTVAVLAAGWPFWLTDLPLRPHFPQDRFILAFMLGGSLIATSILVAIGGSRRSRIAALGMAALLISLAAGQQIRYATEFRREQQSTTHLLWQFMWRVPDLEPGTAIFVNEFPLKFNDDEAITAAINWIYGGDDLSASLSYLVADLNLRFGKSVFSLEENEPITKDFLATDFEGTTSQVLVMAYDPPKCLRVYDVVLHDSLPGIPEPLPSAIPLSDTDLIFADSERVLNPLKGVIGQEPPHGWCYFYEKADLALQQRNWAQVAELGDLAFSLGERPNEASERLPYIEGYAHVGRWKDAIKLSRDMLADQPSMETSLCRLWIRLEQVLADEPAGKEAFAQIFELISCDEVKNES